MAIINTKEVVRLTSLSSSTIRRLESRGLFPSRLHLSAKRVGWNEELINKWIKLQISISRSK